MAMQFYASAEQIMRDRSEYARKGIARGRSVVVLTYAGGVLFVAENLSTRAAQGQRDLRPDRLRRGRPVQRVREPAPRRRPACRPARLLLRPARRHRPGAGQRVRADAGRDLHRAAEAVRGGDLRRRGRRAGSPDADELYRLTYDGSVVDEPGYVAMGGQAEAIATVLKRAAPCRPGPRRRPSRVAVKALRQRRRRRTASQRTIDVGQLEVAVLDRSRPGRAFRRITGAALDRAAAGHETPDGQDTETASENRHRDAGQRDAGQRQRRPSPQSLTGPVSGLAGLRAGPSAACLAPKSEPAGPRRPLLRRWPVRPVPQPSTRTVGPGPGSHVHPAASSAPIAAANRSPAGTLSVGPHVADVEHRVRRCRAAASEPVAGAE